MKIKYRSPMHLDRQNARLGNKHGVHCRLTMGLMIGTTCPYSNFGSYNYCSSRFVNCNKVADVDFVVKICALTTNSA